MRIAIDISQIVYGAGVSTYTKELVTNLLKIDKKNEYVLWGGSLRRQAKIKEFFHTLQGLPFKGRVFPIAPTLADVVWNRLHFFPIERMIGKVDVFHSSDWTQPPSKAYKVTTVHDLIPLMYPEWSDPKIVAVQKRRLGWVKNEVDAIIVPSNQTKKDLIKLGFEGKKINVIHESSSSTLSNSTRSSTKKTMTKFMTGKKYILSVGITSRKNLQRLISAYKLLRSKKGFETYKLVLVGHPHVDVNMVDGVVVTGHVSDKDLAGLYSGAQVLVFPSLYEGFGIPILDAMKLGVPVVTSNSGSIKEVAGNSAVLIDPRSVDSVADGVQKALRNRKILIPKGKKRAKQFSWEKMAQQTLALYEQM